MTTFESSFEVHIRWEFQNIEENFQTRLRQALNRSFQRFQPLVNMFCLILALKQVIDWQTLGDSDINA